jgi:hypothetical protein
MAKTIQSAPSAKKNGGKNGGKSEKTEAKVAAQGNHNGGYALDTGFIGKPHEWDPRRLYSQTGADWQYRVDFERLRKDRLAKMQEQMTKRDIGALVLFAGANVRYVTGSYQGNWKYNINIRYAVVPNGGEPVLFETAGSDLQCAKMDLPWMENRIAPAITWQWAEGAVPYMAGRMAQSVVDVLKEHGLRLTGETPDGV